MSKKIYLALVMHNHQPLGNFADVYESNFNSCYEPMIGMLEKHEQIKATLHYTGSLLDWLKAHRPNFITRVRALVERKQVEILSGGYYEPILVSIPDDDKIGQIQKLTSEVENLFNYKPQGMWLAERVWEPTLVKNIADAGIRYTIVDDTHFKQVGFEEEDLYNYFISEEQGRTLNIFATPYNMRYLIPWRPVKESIDFLRTLASEEGPIAVSGDDGEKFGAWPETFDYIYGEQWLENFFQQIEANSEWLQTTTLADYYATHAPRRRVYLPTASYSEMSEWSMPSRLAERYMAITQDLKPEAEDSQVAADILRFMRGSIWRNFLVKYPEINNQHKKMFYVHQKIAQMPEGELHQEALDNLWKGQCNETYWHGVFGGIYLPHLRTSIYEVLIQAEKLADQTRHQGTWLEIDETDFDYDGKNEVLLNSANQNLYFSPTEGGSLFEWDFRERNFNLLNVLTRRHEAYHGKLVEGAMKLAQAAQEAHMASKEAEESGEIVALENQINFKEQGLEKLLHYDWYRRASFLDHFLAEDTKLDAFYRCDYPEHGDFVNQPYTYIVQPDRSEGEANHVTLAFVRDGHVQSQTVRVEKTFDLEAGSNELNVSYVITNTSESPLHTIFGFETNYGLNSGHSYDSFYTINDHKPEDAYLDSRVETPVVTKLSLENGWFKLRVQLFLDKAATLWRFPVETIQNSEGGFERVYQSSCVLPHWKLALEPGQTWQVEATFKLEALG
jgi:alpha-amylase